MNLTDTNPLGKDYVEIMVKNVYFQYKIYNTKHKKNYFLAKIPLNPKER